MEQNQSFKQIDQSYDSYLHIDGIIAICLICAISAYFIPFIVLLIIKRNQCPIINKSPRLVITQSIANYIMSISILIPKLFPFLSTNQSQDALCKVRGGIQFLNFPLLFMPYVLRAYRLNIVFKLDYHQPNYQNNQVYLPDAFSQSNIKKINSIRETKLCRVINCFYSVYTQHRIQNLIWITLPFLAIFIVYLAIAQQYDDYFPYNEISPCFIQTVYKRQNQNQRNQKIYALNISVLIALGLILLQNLIFAVCIYKVNDISDEFNISEELKLVFVFWGLASFGATAFICFIPFDIMISWSISAYFYILRNILLFFITVQLSVRKTYQRGFRVPHQTKYCAQNFKIASNTHLPSLYFNEYLKKQFQSGHLMFQMYMDVRIYQNLFQSIVMTERDVELSMLNYQQNQNQQSNAINENQGGGGGIGRSGGGGGGGVSRAKQSQQNSRNFNVNRDGALESDNGTELAFIAAGQQRTRAIDIFETYISIDAPFRVMLPKSTVKLIKEAIYQNDDISVMIFDEAMEFLIDKLEDYYTQFKRSESFRFLIQELEKREIQHSVLVRLRMLPDNQ